MAALHTGLRRTALATLTWRDVDLQRRIVWVRPEYSKSAIGQEVPRDRTVYALLPELKPTTSRTPDPVFKHRFGLAFKPLSASHKQNVVYLRDRDSQRFSQQSDCQGVSFGGVR